MSEQNIIEVTLTDEQRVAFAAVLRAAHWPKHQHQAAIMTVVTDSYVPEKQCGVLRLQIAMVDWKTGEKIAAILTEKALSVKESTHFA